MEGILKTAGTVSFNHEVSFTCHGLGLVNWSCSEPDFDFVIGDVFPVHAVLAEFLSAKIARIRRCDPLCYSYTFKNVDPDLLSALQSLVTSLQTGNPFHVNQSNYSAIFRLCQELEINELLSSLLGLFDPESVALEEAIFLLRARINIGSAYAKQFETLRDFVASRFHEINEDILADLDLDTAQLLLSSPSLKIKDEDSLYDFIKSRCEDDIRFASLFEFVYFEYLSQGSIENFAHLVMENLIENLSPGIWSQICRRLLLKPILEQENQRATTTDKAPTGIEFAPEEEPPLDGIIDHLTRECKGNVHDRKVVKVTASSLLRNDTAYHAKNIVDLGTTSFYMSNDEPDTWICYDFKTRRVMPTSYSIKAQGDTPGGHHLKSWALEVSKDGDTWTEVDRREGNDELNAPHVVRNFKITDAPHESFRFIRLRQTGPNHKGQDFLAFSGLEIFGTLFEN